MALATVTPSNLMSVAIVGETVLMLRTFGDLGRAITRLDQDIPALGSESCGDSPCEGVNTLEESCAALDAELELLRSC
jgi:hypothetical protein